MLQLSYYVKRSFGMKSKQWLGIIFLLICSFIWGSTFVAQSETTTGPFTYLAMRSVIAVVFLLPFVLISDAIKRTRQKSECSVNSVASGCESGWGKTVFIGGAVCGLFLFVASALQQIGIDQGTSPGKAGFITALYLLIVPILGLFMKKKVRAVQWFCIVLALVGLFLLCMTGNLKEFSMSALFSTQTLSELSLKMCDVFVLLCAFVFSLQILAIDKYSPKVDCLKLSLIQFAVVTVLSVVAMFIFEKPDFNEILSSWFSIVYAGVLSSGVAYTLQIFGQKYTSPTIASMLMSLESTFAVISSILFSYITTKVAVLPTNYELAGIVLMFSAIMISQIPKRKQRLK